jgi:hypothetical protein
MTQYLDYNGLKYYDQKLKNYINVFDIGDISKTLDNTNVH